MNFSLQNVSIKIRSCGPFLEQLILVVADVDPKSIVLHQKTNQIVLLSDNTGCFAGILMQNIWLKIPAENLEGIEIDDGNTWLM